MSINLPGGFDLSVAPPALEEAPIDGTPYQRKDAVWVPPAIGEAPIDGTPYQRQDGVWVAPAGGGGGVWTLDEEIDLAGVQFSVKSFTQGVPYRFSLFAEKLTSFGLDIGFGVNADGSTTTEATAWNSHWRYYEGSNPLAILDQIRDLLEPTNTVRHRWSITGHLLFSGGTFALKFKALGINADGTLARHVWNDGANRFVGRTHLVLKFFSGAPVTGNIVWEKLV